MSQYGDLPPEIQAFVEKQQAAQVASDQEYEQQTQELLARTYGNQSTQQQPQKYSQRINGKAVIATVVTVAFLGGLGSLVGNCNGGPQRNYKAPNSLVKKLIHNIQRKAP